VISLHLASLPLHKTQQIHHKNRCLPEIFHKTQQIHDKNRCWSEISLNSQMVKKCLWSWISWSWNYFHSRYKFLTRMPVNFKTCSFENTWGHSLWHLKLASLHEAIVRVSWQSRMLLQRSNAIHHILNVFSDSSAYNKKRPLFINKLLLENKFQISWINISWKAIVALMHFQKWTVKL
jgi:hypothetical protein